MPRCVRQRKLPDRLVFHVPSSFETRRLHLRTFRVEDAVALHEAMTESIGELRSTLWFLPWVAEEPTLQTAAARCKQAEASFLLRTDMPYLAFDKAGRLVASFGLHRTDWSLAETEVGYWVRTGETGKGYASEGVVALTAWALEGLGAQRVGLVTDEKNIASRAVAERCGFSLEGVRRNIVMSPDGNLGMSCIYAKRSARRAG